MMTLPLPKVGTRRCPGCPSAGPQYKKMKALCVNTHEPVNGDKINFFYDLSTPYLMINAGYQDEIKGRPEIVHTTRGPAVALAGEYRDRFLIHQHDPDDADYFEPEMAAMIGGSG